MIERLIAFSARNAFVAVLSILAVLGGGIWALRETPIDAIPALSDVQVIVTANWEGRSPPWRRTGSPWRASAPRPASSCCFTWTTPTTGSRPLAA